MGKNSQKRAAAREAEKLEERRAIEEQYGITLPEPSKPIVGGRYLTVRQPSPIRYRIGTRGGLGHGVKAVRRG